MNGAKRRIGHWVLVLLVLFALFIHPSARASERIKHIKMSGEITLATVSYIRHEIDEAHRDGSIAVVLEIDGGDGLVVAAEEIKNILLASRLPIIAFVTGEARNMAVLPALAGARLLMAPNARLGPSIPKPNSKTIQEAWVTLLRSTAKIRGKDPQLAASLADGKLTQNSVPRSCSANEALELGLIDGIAANIEDVLTFSNYQDIEVVNIPVDFRTQITGWLARSDVSTVLFMLGICLIVVEIFSQGLALPGMLGICCLALFYGGGYLSGHASVWATLLFGVAVVLLFIESMSPGMGICGMCGLLALIASLYLGSRSIEHFLITLMLTVVGVAILLPVMVRLYANTEAYRKHERLLEQRNTARASLVGRTGQAVSDIQPSGRARIEGRRWEVWAQMGSIERGTPVLVTALEGGRIFVEPTLEEQHFPLPPPLTIEGEGEALWDEIEEHWQPKSPTRMPIPANEPQPPPWFESTGSHPMADEDEPMEDDSFFLDEDELPDLKEPPQTPQAHTPHDSLPLEPLPDTFKTTQSEPPESNNDPLIDEYSNDSPDASADDDELPVLEDPIPAPSTPSWDVPAQEPEPINDRFSAVESLLDEPLIQQPFIEEIEQFEQIKEIEGIEEVKGIEDFEEPPIRFELDPIRQEPFIPESVSWQGETSVDQPSILASEWEQIEHLSEKPIEESQLSQPVEASQGNEGPWGTDPQIVAIPAIDMMELDDDPANPLSVESGDNFTPPPPGPSISQTREDHPAVLWFPSDRIEPDRAPKPTGEVQQAHTPEAPKSIAPMQEEFDGMLPMQKHAPTAPLIAPQTTVRPIPATPQNTSPVAPMPAFEEGDWPEG